MEPNNPRRQMILQAAESLFQHYGTQKTTVADIAKTAGVGVGSVYLEFPSKNAIIAALSEFRFSRVLQRMEEAAQTPTSSYAARLQSLLNARIKALLELAEGGTHAPDLLHSGCLVVEASYCQFNEKETRMVQELLEAGMEAGNLKRPDPDVTAKLLLRALMSFSPPWIFRKDKQELLGLAESFHRLLFSGLLRR